jgi:hypothetical protein
VTEREVSAKSDRPNHDDRRKGDRQRSLVAVVDQNYVKESSETKTN